MKNKKMLLILVIIILLIITAFAIWRVAKKNSLEMKFKLDSSDKYLVTTNMKMMTMMSDGGSHYNGYYEIDFQNNTVKKCEDYYKATFYANNMSYFISRYIIGFNGYVYREKVLDTKVLSAQESIELRNLLDRVLNDGGSEYVSPDDTSEKPLGIDINKYFNYYTISTEKYTDIKMGNGDDIEIFNSLVFQ